MGSLPCKLRNFAEILNEEKQHRNILEVKLTRTHSIDEKGDQVKVKTLTEEDISELFFDVIKLKMEDCCGHMRHLMSNDAYDINI